MTDQVEEYTSVNSGSSVVGRDIYISHVPSIVQSGNPTTQLIVHVEESDINSHQVQCLVKIENTGSERIRIHSVRPLNPAGTSLQQEIDFASSESKTTRDELYRDLSNLLNVHLIKASEEYRKSTIEAFLKTFGAMVRPNSILKAYIFFMTSRGKVFVRDATDNARAWYIHISDLDHAKYCYDNFLEHSEAVEAPLRDIYKAKLAQLDNLEKTYPAVL